VFLTHADLASPIASDIAFLAHLNSNGTFGNVFRGYVGDLNGNVWRLDIGGAPNTWIVHKFAELGPGLPQDKVLKFMYAPDLVKAGDKNMVLIGSGDRERPLLTTSDDKFFGLMDTKVAETKEPAGGITKIVMGDLQELTGLTGFDGSCPTCKGWYRKMGTGGEKVVNSPLTVAGVTYFATNKPTPPVVGSCDSNLGEARNYAISFLTGAAPAGRTTVSTVLTGGGLAPSPVAGVVDLGKPDGSEGGEKVSFCIGCDPEQRLPPTRPNIIVPTNRQKIYWNLKTDG
jgi:type IV pilus assembly protein PilY1